MTFDGVSKVYPGAKGSPSTVAVDDLSLEVGDGEFLILVGPSGCGKSTALRMVAGLEKISAGEIRVDGERINDVPPRDRDIAMVFQNYALYPHMTVAKNLAFGLRQRKTPRAEVSARVAAVSSTLGLDELLSRRPGQLSGGQRQRVAMGRALVREPRAFLMDEPLSNLDAKLRVQMRAELKKLHHRLGTTTIYVTHDQVEAMTLGERIAVMNAGLLQQIGVPQDVYDRPANVFVAGFIGSPPMNLLRGTVSGTTVSAGVFSFARPGLADGPITIGIRPETFRPTTEAGTVGPSIDLQVDVVEPLGDEVLVHGTLDARAAQSGAEAEDAVLLAETSTRAPVTVRLAPDSRPAPGDRMPLTADPMAVHLFDASSGDAIR
ncbi:MAG TPA: sn-glycerol-3-phosphate ABC transporter ATP-binding protein UgpC [Actinomycetota bacterium]